MFSYSKVNTSGLQLLKKKKKAICFHRSTEGSSAYAVSFTQKHGKKMKQPLEFTTKATSTMIQKMFLEVGTLSV